MESSLSTRFLSNIKNHLGINGPHEMLMHLPNGYLDFRKPVLRVTEALQAAKPVYFKAIVKFKPKTHTFKKTLANGEVKDSSLCAMTFSDGITNFEGTTFGDSDPFKHLNVNDVVFLYGKMVKRDGKIQMQNFALVPEYNQGTIVPTYKGKEKKISPVTMAIHMKTVLSENLQHNVDHLCSIFALTEAEILSHALIPFSSLHRMFHAIHRPKDDVELARAEDAVTKLNGFYAVNMSLKAEEFEQTDASSINVSVEMLKFLTGNMIMRQGDEERKITLTEDQKRSIWNIIKDLARNKPSRHLIMGDVGCGKTFSYMVPAVAAQKLGKKVCILMPNILLAQQVANEISATYADVDTLLVLGRKQKDTETKLINPIVVGTSAIIGWARKQEAKHEFDLVIIDEQQKVGMSHKNAVLAPHTNLIEASATPIPRTLAHAVYGGKRVSYIENCPVEKDISSIIVAEDEKRIAMEKLKDWVSKGRQVAILYPLKQPEIPVYELIVPERFNYEFVKENLTTAGAKRPRVYSDISKSRFSDLTGEGYYLIRFNCPDNCIGDVRDFVSAIDDADEIILMTDDADDDEKERNIRSVEEAYTQWEKLFPGQVLKIHGGMPTPAKLEAARNAKTGKWPIIITSTVIEIGLTMPNLFCMLVVEADNLGASTLHQLRGRLVRLGGFGEFIMHTPALRKNINADTLQRLTIIVNHKKGSEIAEADMRLRGFGDLSKSAIRQSGAAKGLFPGMKVTPEQVDAFLAACLKQSLKAQAA